MEVYPLKKNLYTSGSVIKEHRLYLPRTIEEISEHYIPVSETCETVWNNGPQNDSQAELSRCLKELGSAFCSMAKVHQSHLTVSTKGDDLDNVTNVDIGIELLFRQWLSRFYPHHKVIGEEGEKSKLSEDDFIWYVDPIDGTTNYMNQKKEVTMHFGCVKDGKPYTSFVGKPIWDTYYWTDGKTVFEKDTLVPSKGTPSNTQLTIGTEYLWGRDEQKVLYNQLSNLFHAKPYRARSIGYSITETLLGNVDLFYKPAVKLWDVIAPICLIKVLRPDLLTQLTYASTNHPLSKENAVTEDALSNSSSLIKHLNLRHETSFRAGFVAIYPPRLTAIRDGIFDALYPEFFETEP